MGTVIPPPHTTDFRYCPTCRAAYPSDFAACPRDGSALEVGVDPLVGVELRDTYRITHVLGEGALGRVYHASHLRLPRSYAIKVPRGIWVDHPKARLRFFNEATAASRLNHPNIASVFDVGETADGLPYLVMEFAGGTPLTSRIPVLGRRVRDALLLARQIAAGLDHAHQHAVVHRDLKPDNILVEGGRVRIVDFGIAILTERGDEGRLTTIGSTIGTPQYMAPEQLLGTAIDRRADLYALGAIFYELLAGVRPYAGSTVEYAHQVVEGRLPRFAQRVPGVAIDPRVEELVRRLMATEPGDRPADAGQVVAAIDGFLALPQVPDSTGSQPVPVAAEPTLQIEGSRTRWWNPTTWWRR